VSTRPGPYFGFVGVSTAGSSIMRVFPAWAERLHLPTRRLVGHDVPLGAPPAAFRELVARIAADERHLGALVTTHKMSVYAAARDLFAELDPYAVRFAEVSALSKRDGALVGHAKDPVSAALAAAELVPAGHFAATGADVVCLGTGGAGLAIAHALAERSDRPRRIVCADVAADRLAHGRALLTGAFGPDGLDFRLVTAPADADTLVTGAAPGSLVVNATGLGKDRPGSPLTGAAVFPAGAFAWDINYRGDLGFLAQARRQAGARGLTVADGWRYFIHGWTQVLAEVFALTIDAATLTELADLADTAGRAGRAGRDR
jgi:shikimate dehydrogenase